MNGWMDYGGYNYVYEIETSKNVPAQAIRGLVGRFLIVFSLGSKYGVAVTQFSLTVYLKILNIYSIPAF